MGKKKWVTITLREHFLVPEEYTNEECATHMIQSLARDGGWPGVTVTPGPPELYKHVAEDEDYQMNSDFYNLHLGTFNYTGADTHITLNSGSPQIFNVAELLEHGFEEGDQVVFGTLHDNTSKIVFVGKQDECSTQKLIPALQKLYEHGPTFDCMYIETILMEMYKTIVINYV